jgi:hypothetical protein
MKFLQTPSAKLAFGIPFMGLLAFALFSSPMMYPGFDIWIHLVAAEYGGRGTRLWYDLLSFAFNTFALESPFAKAKLVHSVQIILASLLVFASSLWVLRLLDKQRQASHALINLLAWFAVFVWMIMQGTVSAPHYNSTNVWYAWTLWYSVNYQIALPLFIFAVSSLLYGMVSDRQTLGSLGRWPYFLAFLISALGVAAIHAAEAPYIVFSLLLIAIIWFNRSLRWQYLLVLLLCALVIYVGLQYSHYKPQGFIIYNKGGFSALLDAIAARGQLMTEGGFNRGNASWNYWYSVNVAMAFVITLLALLSKKIGIVINWRIAAFVLLSAIPAAMLQLTATAGIIPMITTTGHAWRFTFSSFLFLAPSIALLSIALRCPKLATTRLQILLAATLVVMVLTASKLTEKNWVSYQYARSLALALNPHQMRFGLTHEQTQWLDSVHQQLLTNPPKQVVCTDMFTAYYLFFVKGYRNVGLNADIPRPARLPRATKCTFPQDGGDIRNLNLGPVPWNFDLSTPPWWK